MEESNFPGSAHRDIEHSCTECRRRKAKCDRLHPQCGSCAKFHRTCSYARPARTPLTRRYVTELERELARAQELLRKSGTPLQADSISSHHVHGGMQYDSGMTAELALDSRASIAEPSSPVDRNVALQRNGDLSTGRDQLRQLPSTGANTSSSHLTKSSQNFSLETPPASGDFDWDERNISNGDGMASLTNATNRGGYLGVASGAALLRLADSESDAVAMYGSGNDALGDESTHISTPITRAIYSLSQLEPFVNAYFQLYHVSYPIVHEATFRAQESQFMEVIPRPRNKAWHVLLYIVSALGAFTTAETLNDLDLALFEAAKARLSIDMLETGNLAFVQALTLISNYVQKRNKPNSGYNYTGLAKRVALGIGLHKEFTTWHAKPLMLEMRRRVWWALFVFDVGASITFSRPLDLPEGGVEVNLPLNVHDGDITTTTRHSPPEVNEVTLYTHVRCQSQFHLASGPIYARLLSTPFPDAKELIDLDDLKIANFVTNLPAYFREDVQQAPRYRLCHAILKWRCRNFRILMYRPFVIRHVMLKAHDERRDTLVRLRDGPNRFEKTAIQRCLDAASETVDLITIFWQQEKHSMMACWYSLYFLFQAILIPVICLRNDPQSAQATNWRDQIFRASETIASMSHLNHAAIRCHATIMSLCGAYLSENQGNWNEPVHESPQTQLNGLYPFMWPILDGIQAEGYDSALHESAIQDFMNQITGMQ